MKKQQKITLLRLDYDYEKTTEIKHEQSIKVTRPDNGNGKWHGYNAGSLTQRTRRTGTGQREMQTIYTHQVRAQVETVRGKADNQTSGKTHRGRSKLPGMRGELDFKIKQEITRQHRHETKTN